MNTINQSMMGNEELIKQLIDLYILQSPTDFKALEDAIISGDIEIIRKLAHHIKPTMQYIGAENLLQHFQILETKAKERASITEIEDIFYQIKPDFHLMLDELRILSNS